MANVAQSEMDVDAFLAWAEGREGRWELREGQPVLMSAEPAAHALTKFAAQSGLNAAIRRALAVPCFPGRHDSPDRVPHRVRARRAWRLPSPDPPQHDGDPEPGHRG
jgi:hypothetical protein